MIQKFRATCIGNPQVEILAERLLNGLARSRNLCSIYEKEFKGKRGRKDTGKSDLLRSAVVFAHATVEEGIRTLASYKLEDCDETTLNNIPLVGINNSGKAEKFHLGRLATHREKLIKEVTTVQLTPRLCYTTC